VPAESGNVSSWATGEESPTWVTRIGCWNRRQLSIALIGGAVTEPGGEGLHANG
jgi:hypothetical protein